jgi:hypothetical protein
MQQKFAFDAEFSSSEATCLLEMLTIRSKEGIRDSPVAAGLGLAALVLPLLGWRVFYAGIGVPIQVGDALFFIPTALQHMLFGDLSNPFLSPIQDGGGPYTWHGWLYPMLLSALGRLVGAQGVRALQVLDTLLILLAALIFAWKVGSVRASAWLKAATVICACAMFAAGSGRPEVPAQLLLVIWLASVRWPLDARSEALTALLLALIAVAQPTIALLAGVFYATYRCHASPMREALRAIAWVAASSVAAALILTLLIYPWSLSELVHGVLEQARSLSRRNDGNFVQIYLLWSRSPLQLAWLILLVALAAVLQARSLIRPPASLVFWPLLLLGVYLVWRFGMRTTYTAYNVGVFFPLVAYALLVASGDERLRPMNWMFKAGLAGMALVLLMTQLRTLAVFERAAGDTALISGLLRSVDEDLSAGRRVAISANLVLANYAWVGQRNLSVLSLADIARAGQADVVYLNQASTGARSPGQYAGWRLEGDHYMDGVRLLGKSIANTPVSYAYARYVRSGAAAPARTAAPANSTVPERN